jgi:uncharacterized protein YyaL (SSP411 family)
MEHESFEKEDVAQVLNRDFVAIMRTAKSARRDDIYMSAVQAMTGSGGWLPPS